MKRKVIKNISLATLCCFFSLLISDSYPLYAAAERDGIALIEKGEAEYSDGFYQEALDYFNRALEMVEKDKNRKRLFLDISLVYYALGNAEQCQKTLHSLLELDPEMKVDQEEFPKGFLRFFDKVSGQVQKEIAEQEKLEEQKRLEEHEMAKALKRAEEEKKRLAEVKRIEELKRLEELKNAEEQKRLEELEKARALKKVEEERIKQEEQKRIEELKKFEELRKAEELKKLEEQRKGAELKKVEEEQKRKEELKKLEELKKQEEIRKAEEQKRLDELRKIEDQKRIEALKKAEEEKKQQEDARVLEEQKQQEEMHVAEESKKLEEQKNAEEVKKAEEQLKLESGKSATEKKETTQVLTIETTKTEATQPSVQEKGKPAPQLKKKKKFPWLLVILGVGIVAALVVLLGKKKSTNPSGTQYGSIQVRSTPAGAKIYLDGIDTGKVTNTILEQVIVGSHSIKLTLANYPDYITTINVRWNIQEALIITLTPTNTYINGILTVKGVRYELASIPAGTFQMGSNSSEANSDERPVHNVRISKGFWMGKTEVTQALWEAVVIRNPSNFKDGANYPVENVTWNDCQKFIDGLNSMLGGGNFRLPTEAEWEYACRAGTTGERYGDINVVAWYKNNSGLRTHQVAQKQANNWGLFDMLGNVEEWCQDRYGTYSSDYQIDPQGPPSGDGRIVRGGCWYREAHSIRAAFRYGFAPTIIDPGKNGLRIACGSAGK